MAKVVVFGGSGFLGSHVCEELVSRGHEVVNFDRSKRDGFEVGVFVQGDILDQTKVDLAVEEADYVYNFAGLSDINDAKNKPTKTAQLNILGNANILEACAKAKVKRFFFASSVYVCGDSGSFYCASKQASERYTELYFDRYQLPFTILRYGSLYGRRADGRNAIYRFIHEALKNGKISYKGTGDEIREYIHIEDAARASVQALDSDFRNQHIVVTGSQVFRVKDVLKMIQEILGDSDIKIQFENCDIDSHYNVTPYRYKPSLGRKFVMNPFVDMGQGILDCVHEISDCEGISSSIKEGLSRQPISG